MKGLDKAKVVFVEAHVEMVCAVCNYTFDEFPATDGLIFNCPKCNRYFKFESKVRPLTKDEIQAYEEHRTRSKSNRNSFNDL